MGYRNLTAALLTVIWGECAIADQYSGIARVIDGDTIEVSGQRIRLQGIDAPEHKQICKRDGVDWRCGREATRALNDKIDQKPVRCVEQDRDRFRRIIAKCYVEDTDISEWLVHNGWALAYVEYSHDYIRAERFASLERLGIWASEFVMPWEWRKARSSDGPSTASQIHSQTNTR
ncbi:MAG: succinoglycan biosynthesis protein [Alphaproteobacteria bacterium]|nr:succinoglycan biosynthesis protein [Alphaproteobacteria bacterium]|tara:strand:+ start:5844 stop:6368 length:525 start_codon:yes stop_codon:yes gene_type:complete